MQHLMKKTFPIAIAVILLSAITMVSYATHVATVSISPAQVQIGTEAEFKVLVENQGGDSITYFELVLPMSDEGKPYFIMTEVAEPSGWDLNTVYKVGSSYPYDVTWSAVGVGIDEGKSLEFIFKAKAPSNIDEFTWSWKTIDATGDVRTGGQTIRTILASFNAIEVSVPKNIKAGDYFQVTVTTIDKDGEVKSDFGGTVSFACSDQLAILPEDYTYKIADSGSKQFTFKLKTAGDQSITVNSVDVSLTSDLFYVKQDDTVGIRVSLDKESVGSGGSVDINVFSVDVFGNELDVTLDADFDIDKEAGGKFTDNVYEAENLGTWTIVASYLSTGKFFHDGVTLSVTGEEVVEEEVKEEVIEEIVEVNETAEEEEQVELKELTLSTPESIVTEPGETVDFNATVENTGDVDLTNVAVQLSGIPETWVSTVPTFINIAAGESQNYLVNVTVPVTESGVKIMTITAKSVEEVTATKTVSLTIGGKTGVTGLFARVFDRPVYVGLLIVILIIAILIIWKLIPSSDTKKKSEE